MICEYMWYFQPRCLFQGIIHWVQTSPDLSQLRAFRAAWMIYFPSSAYRLANWPAVDSLDQRDPLRALPNSAGNRENRRLRVDKAISMYEIYVNITVYLKIWLKTSVNVYAVSNQLAMCFQWPALCNGSSNSRRVGICFVQQQQFISIETQGISFSNARLCDLPNICLYALTKVCE
jgi:hypothetical protein